MNTVPSTEQHLLPKSPSRPRLVPASTPLAARGWPRHIIVGTDGSPGSDAAVSVSVRFGQRTGATVENVAVFAPGIPRPRRGAHDRRDWTPSDRHEAARLLSAVRRQRRGLRGESAAGPRVPVRVEIGDPGLTLVEVASEVGADMIVTGIRSKPGPGRRTAVTIARYATVPLLAVAPGCDGMSSAVLGLPDGRIDPATLVPTLRCLLSHSHIWIVVPARRAVDDAQARERVLREAVDGSGDAHCAAAMTTHSVRFVDVAGDMLVGLLRVAAQVQAQLIAVRETGEPGPVRAFLPNIAEPLLLASPCSVLVIPDQVPRS